MKTKDYLTTEQVAEAINEPVGTLTRLRSQGRGPVYYRFGRKVRYILEDVKTWQDKAYRVVKPRAI